MRLLALRVWPRCLSAGALIALAACGSDLVAPQHATDPSQLYWALELDRHAVNLTAEPPYDTIRLVATPRTVNGDAITDLPAPTFKSSNIEQVQVDESGLVRVIKAGSQPVDVVATLTAGGLTHADTVRISTAPNVSPSALATFSIHPVPPATATFPMGGDPPSLGTIASFNLPTTAVDQEGDTLKKLAVHFTSADPTTATVEPFTGKVTPAHPGRVTFYASTHAYGTTSVDTLDYTITLPLQVVIIGHTSASADGDPMIVFDVPVATIAVGGRIIWSNPTDLPVDIRFDDPTGAAQVDKFCVPPFTSFGPLLCGEGDAEPFATNPDYPLPAVARRFPAAGTYTYHTKFGTTGKIIVVDESQP